ncbi:MAG: beta-ketoacyl synthase chain length factor [Burkholderiales bacterium]
MSGLRVWVQGIGLLGPGLASWASARDVMRGVQAHEGAPTVLPPPARLPPAERRRAGAAVKLALAIADEAVSQAQLDPATLATVFTSSSGEGVNCHALCETLATPAPMVSPTRFTNSVHNAAAGCWHIAVASRASSTSLCAFDGSFSAGLIEAATSAQLTGLPVLLVASDSPYPEPLHAKRPLPDHFGAALVLAPEPNALTLAEVTFTLESSAADPSRCDDPTLEALRRAIPAACALPLLAALARPRARQRIVLDYLPQLRLRIDLA